MSSFRARQALSWHTEWSVYSKSEKAQRTAKAMASEHEVKKVGIGPVWRNWVRSWVPLHGRKKQTQGGPGLCHCLQAIEVMKASPRV